MAKNITAFFDTADRAVDAVNSLELSGFARDDISMLMSDATRGRQLAVHEKTKTAEGAAAGAAAGGAMGAIAAGLLAAGTIVAPPLGLFAAGPIVAAIAGIGAGGTVGGILGAVVGSGIPEHQVKLFSDRLEKGGVLVGVRTHDDRSEKAEEVLEAAGGEHVHVS